MEKTQRKSSLLVCALADCLVVSPVAVYSSCQGERSGGGLPRTFAEAYRWWDFRVTTELSQLIRPTVGVPNITGEAGNLAPLLWNQWEKWMATPLRTVLHAPTVAEKKPRAAAGVI
ncbi:unnamed protein product [Linum trigynum]|uniref:Uncharacterized protein n=1 Tax=Linum trigynum TaxID=586398 RepID=A0AAV2G979_9ROSI